MSRKLVLIIAVVLAAGAVTAGIAIASGVGGDDEPLTGSTLAKASSAALAYTKGGTIVESEVAAMTALQYEVEVRLGNGNVVEVELDESYRVIGQEADDDGPNDDDGSDGND